MVKVLASWGGFDFVHGLMKYAEMDSLMKTHLCPLPFLQVDMNSEGHYSPCCESACSPTSTTKNHSARDWFESEELSALRATFLSGQSPLACKGCYQREFRGLESKREMALQSVQTGVFGKNLENIYESPEIRFVNYRFGNDCNLSCLMCCAESSTTFGQEAEKLGETKYVKFSNDLRLEDDELRRLASIYFGGGEPAMSKNSFHILDRLVALGNTQLDVILNTNGSLPRSPLFEKLRRFNNVHITFSIDGCGETYNLLRYPMRWEKLCENLEYFLKEFPTFHFGLIFTINCVNAANTTEFLRWWIQINERSHGKLLTFELNDVNFPTFLRLELISETEKHSLLNELTALLASCQTESRAKFRPTIAQMIQRISLIRTVLDPLENETRKRFIETRRSLRQS
jgi:pyruvate-formate lyase-activating enzyme